MKEANDYYMHGLQVRVVCLLIRAILFNYRHGLQVRAGWLIDLVTGTDYKSALSSFKYLINI
jgi:hypothetical protein